MKGITTLEPFLTEAQLTQMLWKRNIIDLKLTTCPSTSEGGKRAVGEKEAILSQRDTSAVSQKQGDCKTVEEHHGKNQCLDSGFQMQVSLVKWGGEQNRGQ